MWHGIRVGAFRKNAGIPYPQYYADNQAMSSASPEQKKQMYLFNCAQRGHGNFLENHPSAVIALLLAGVEYPITSTVLGVGWSISRIVYAVGYTRPDKDKGQGRLAGLTFWFFQLGLFGLTGWSGLKMVMWL